MAKIYTHRSSAASGELRWWEGSRPERSKDFLSHQLSNWSLASKDCNRNSRKHARQDISRVSTSSPMGIFHQPKCSSYLFPAETKPTERGQTLLPLPYILPENTPLQWVLLWSFRRMSKLDHFQCTPTQMLSWAESPGASW